MEPKAIQADGSVQREAKLSVEKKDNPLGAWDVFVESCPLRPHLLALGMKPRACISGIQTNCQGAVPLASCEFYEKESAKREKKHFTIQCRKSNE